MDISNAPTTTYRPEQSSYLKPNRKMKIGAVAKHFNVSVDLLRLYEREGLLIPLKSDKGTRYYTENDMEWISTLLRLVRESGLNFAGIRYLTALLPCWETHRCSGPEQEKCTLAMSAAEPCWVRQTCCQAERDCYTCEVYRSAPKCTNLKAVLRPTVQVGSAD